MELPAKLVRLIKRNKEKDIKRQFKETDNDRCVVCWCPTEYQSSMPIALRQHYIDGCGQMCEACYLRVRMTGKEMDSDGEGTEA